LAIVTLTACPAGADALEAGLDVAVAGWFAAGEAVTGADFSEQAAKKAAKKISVNANGAIRVVII
jgi:hypothetical protein